jgi:hypothetical protein
MFVFSDNTFLFGFTYSHLLKRLAASETHCLHRILKMYGSMKNLFATLNINDEYCSASINIPEIVFENITNELNNKKLQMLGWLKCLSIDIVTLTPM